jgi:hypothetical protein
MSRLSVPNLESDSDPSGQIYAQVEIDFPAVA